MQNKPTKNLIRSEKKLTEDEAEQLAKELKTKLRNGHPLMAGDKDIEMMVAGLGDKRGLLRRTFAESLGVVGHAAVPALRWALLHHSNVTVRRAAAKTLKLVEDPSTLPDLLEALIKDPDPVVQGSAIGAMAIFGEKAVSPLQEILKDPKSNSMQCGLASWGLAFIGAKAPEALKEAAASKNSRLRAAAIAALGDQIQSLNDAEAREIVHKALDDIEPEVRAEASTLLGKLDDNDLAIPLLLKKLDDINVHVRKNAALSLMKLNAFDSIQEIKKRVSKESNQSVKSVFNLAINQLSKDS